MHIALVAPAQHESLVDLLCELHAYYRAPDDPQPAPTREQVRAHLRERLLSETSPLRLVVAAHPDGRVVALAAIVLQHSVVDPRPHSSGQCQVKELYVGEQARSAGVGRALMAWVTWYALEQGCARMDWNVKATNHRGQAFYEGLGAHRVADRLSYRLEREGMDRLVGAATAQSSAEPSRHFSRG